MPEHVHLLVSEPERGKLSVAIQMLKQNVAQKLGTGGLFWQARYYDFNVWSEHKRMEKLGYIYRNPVQRGLVENREDWEWSSFRHYVSGVEGVVEIESQWTARKRERLGITLQLSAPSLQKAEGQGLGTPRGKSGKGWASLLLVTKVPLHLESLVLHF
jgi:putative transposase